MKNYVAAFAAIAPLLMTFFAGAGLPVQAALNSRLGREFGSPLFGSFFSFCIGTVSVLLFVLISRVAAPVGGFGAVAARLPWWLWLGGVIGAVFVSVAAMYAGRLGVTVFSATVIAGQLVASVILDHFGILVAERHPVSALRLFGIALLIAGIALIRRG
ncbi:MAG: DMT family transporter [Armatimonadetes bacterium]|nr:DMT family transporter [Armatimonadota bacterium]